jgi:hypothetical protein
MYAGGWISHSQLHAPRFRPVVRPVQVSRPSLPVISTPAITLPKEDVVMSVPKIIETLDTIVSTPGKLGISWVISSIIVIIVIITSVVYNIKQLQDIEYYKAAVASAQDMLQNVNKKTVTATKAVDPAELQCMSENIYFEAGGESLAGKMAVGHVVLNRMKRPEYPKTACAVIHQKNGDTCMFSWLCEPRKEIKQSKSWQQSQEVAYTLLSRTTEDITEGSTNFHGTHMDPKWNLKRTVKIDGHQFYR